MSTYVSAVYLPELSDNHPGEGPAEDLLRISIALVLSTATVIALLIADPRFEHWFVIPTILCGGLIGADAIAFFQRRVDLLDPIAIIGALGVHFFFFAPLLHVISNEWMLYITPPPDWRPWLGGMALLNTAGLLIYRFSRRIPWFRSGAVTVWQFDPSRTPVVFGVFLLVAAVLQIYVYVHFGGFSGYIDTYLEGQRNYGKRDAGVGFVGMGWLFTVSESFPILAMLLLVHYLRSTNRRPRWPFLFAILGAYFGVVMLFGGLRGSRSNTVWALFWGLGVIHCRLRKVTFGVVLAGTAFLLMFMYFYGFYKDAGADAILALKGGEHREELEQRTGRTMTGALLGDLARSDVQAFALYRMVTAPNDYDYAWGRSYLGAVSLLIPHAVWADRPETKIVETTQLETGRGSFVPGVWQSSRVYGLAGEAMLNFGPAVAPFAFLLLGLVVSLVRACVGRLTSTDSRWLLAPLLVMFAFQVLVNDSDVILFFIIKYGLVPAVAVVMSSRRFTLAPE